MLPWLKKDDLEFPSSATALSEPNGLLAGGGDLSLARLLAAYKRGIFPWFSPGQPILWWTPDPRTVFYPGQVHCSQSMRRFLAKMDWRTTIDRAFVQVMEACASRRPQSSGTWITASMKHAYKNMHQAGYAHSLEVWEGTELVGGLYGVAMGKVFFGESMFSGRTNASKVAVIVLARFLDRNGFQLFDCQVASDHLFSLGATSITRATFEQILQENTDQATTTNLQLLWQIAANKEISIDGNIRH